MPRRTIPISGVYRYQCSLIPERCVFSESKKTAQPLDFELVVFNESKMYCTTRVV